MANREGRFAHFMGFGRSSNLAAGDPDNADDADDNKDGKKGRRAEDDDDGKGAEGDNDGKGDTDDDGKSSRRAEGDDRNCDDDDDEEMHGKSAAASARRRERARCAAIFASPQAAANTALACSLAFETNMSRQEAIAVLASQPRRAVAPDRSAGNPQIGPGGKPSKGAATTQDSWAAAFEANGVKAAARPLLRG